MKFSINRVSRLAAAIIVLAFLTGYILLSRQSESAAVHAQVSPKQSSSENPKQPQHRISDFRPQPNQSFATGENASVTPESPSATAATFSNAAPITIRDGATALPYPSTITVTGQTGVISNLTVNINNFTHLASSNVSILLVGPTGQKMILFSQAGGAASTFNSTLTFDDAATAHLTQLGALSTGTYKPSNYAGVDVGSEPIFPAPAPGATPASPYRSTLASFNQTAPNGVWSLYVVDSNADGSEGAIATGWSLNITTTASPVNRSNQFVLFQGSLTASDTPQTGRLSRNNVVSETDNGKTCPLGTPFGGDALVYDTYTVTNQNTVAVPVTVTTTSACGMNVFASAYTNYSPAAGLCTNYLADAGTSPGTVAGAGPGFSFVINPNQTVTLVANNNTAGNYCSAYSLLVEGNIVNPTAAGAQIGGQVLSPTGKTVSNAVVTVTDLQGRARQIKTNAFGRFNFDNLEAGTTYIIGVTSKQYRFNPQAVNLTNNVSDLIITAEQ